MAQEIGTTVVVRGTPYRVTSRRSTNDCGSKFYGRYVFTLVNSEAGTFTAYGKAVSHNSTLRKVES